MAEAGTERGLRGGRCAREAAGAGAGGHGKDGTVCTSDSETER